MNTPPTERAPPQCFSNLCQNKEWCGWRDLNPHASRRQNLNLVRLPISPHPHIAGTSLPPVRVSLAKLIAGCEWKMHLCSSKFSRAPPRQAPIFTRPKAAKFSFRPFSRLFAYFLITTQKLTLAFRPKTPYPIVAPSGTWDQHDITQVRRPRDEKNRSHHQAIQT